MAYSEEHLSAYKSTCEKHPDLKSFDSSLQIRTNEVIDSLITGAETGLLSQHEIHMEVSKHLVEVNQVVANFITESHNDVWENKALKSLVEAYFVNTTKTLDIFKTIEIDVKNAEKGEHIIEEATKQFHKESIENAVSRRKKNYVKTLEELNKLEAMGDSFDGDKLTAKLMLIQEQQESLLKEVGELRKKVHDDITIVENVSVISNVVFGAAFAQVAIGSVALMATGVGAPIGLIGALLLPVIAVGWVVVHTTLENQIDALKKQENTEEVEKAYFTNIEAMATVSVLVKHLKHKLSFVCRISNTAQKQSNDVAMRLILNLLKGEVKKVTEDIKEVGENVAKLSKLIVEARKHVQEKVNR